MKGVLIVGKNSYIGNCLGKWLTPDDSNDYFVDKVSVRNDEWKTLNLGKYDVILYLSGMVHIKEKKELWPEYIRLNAELPFEFAKKAKEFGVAHFIFFSTKAVYRPNTKIIDRETETDPKKLYGKSKLEGERRILSIADDAFRVSILRPPVVYGEGSKGNFPKLVKLSKTIHVFPKIYNKRSMIYIWNLCEFVRRLIEDPVSESIVFPQDKNPCGAIDIMVSIWEERQERYHLSGLLAFCVRILLKIRICNTLNTMFMDTIYSSRISDYYDYEYCIYSLGEAIRNMGAFIER